MRLRCAAPLEYRREGAQVSTAAEQLHGKPLAAANPGAPRQLTRSVQQTDTTVGDPGALRGGPYRRSI